MSLRIFSKALVCLTLFLIFAGGMVTSTGSGLSVPDWPLSYGMLFPPMVGGVFYEHGHRLIAGFVAVCTLALALWIAIKEKRFWLKILGFATLGSVILQAVLGGLTVLFYLPTAISASHATLAQTFLVLTIIVAYGLSRERQSREGSPDTVYPAFLRWVLVLIGLIYAQLIIGAIMRHTESGLAIYDFPTMGGEWWPTFDQKMLANINDWRFMHGYDPVNLNQVLYHFFHRMGALVIFTAVIILNILAKKYYTFSSKQWRTVILLDILVISQITLGILTVLTIKSAIITSVHVVSGAGLLGLTFLLLLRAAPLQWHEFTKALKQ